MPSESGRTAFTHRPECRAGLIPPFPNSEPPAPGGSSRPEPHAIHLHHERRVQDGPAQAPDHQGHLARSSPGAKIGLLGLNGAGKSTVLKIMAGVDQDFVGEARPQPASRSATWPQEPQLDPKKTVRQAVEEGVGEVLQARRARRVRRLRRGRRGLRRAGKGTGRLEAIIAAGDAHTLENQLEVAADALRLPPWDAVVGKLSGGEKRRVALCRLLLQKPTCCCWTNRPTTSTPSRWNGWSSSCPLPAPWSRSPRPLLPRQRRGAGSSNSTADAASRGRATTPNGWAEGRAPGSRKRIVGKGAAEGDPEGTGVGAAEPQGRPGQGQGAPGAHRGAAVGRLPEAQRDQRNLHPAGRTPGQQGDRVQGTCRRRPSATAC